MNDASDPFCAKPELAETSALAGRKKATTSTENAILSAVKAFDEAERYPDSLATLDRALEAIPNDTSLLLARASTLYAWGRIREAYMAFLRAEGAGLSGPVLDVRLGWTCHQLGKPDEAEMRMRRAVAAQPESPESHFGLAAVLQASKRLDDAIATYEDAIRRASDHVHALINIGVCFIDQGNFATAEAWFRRAIQLYPRNTRAWSNLGVALFRQDRTEAFEVYEHARALEAEGAEDAETFFNYANGLQNFDRTQEAISIYEQNLAQRPTTMGMAQYGMTLLAEGRLREGWNYYEFRWFQEPMLSLRADFHKPAWSGQDLTGKAILLRVEQGLGDVFQFIRFAREVKALGATVLFQSRVGLEALPPGFFGVDAIPVADQPFPSFDYYAHLMSLPRVLGVEVDSIPADVPYLHPDTARVEEWKRRLYADDALNVGIVWAGSPEHFKDQVRSIPLRFLLPLLEVQGVRYWSLQKGAAAAQLNEFPEYATIGNLDSHLHDFGDTAAVVAAMDLVISVDTAAAHLAGGLGTPVWVLLPSHAEWRWLQHREDSPWYPTARLFRQRARGDWADVVDRVKAALTEQVRTMRQGLPQSEPRRAQRACERTPLRAPRGFSPITVASGMTAVAEIRSGILQYLPGDNGASDSAGWYGEWLQPQLDLLARLMRLGQTVIEVGAGVGAHTVPMAHGLGPEAHVIIYESDRLLRRILRQNLQANRLVNLTVMPRRLKGQPAQDEVGDDRALPADTIDSLRLERLDWLKINAGDAAEEVLQDAAESLWRFRPRLFVAARDEQQLSRLSSLIGMFGYRRWRVDTPLFNPNNFNCVDRDIFGGRVSIALLAIPEEIDVDIPAGHCVELPL